MFLLPLYLNLYCLLFLCYVKVSVLLVSYFLVIFRNRFLSCGLITGVCITSLFFESWFTNEFMILSLFLSCSLRNDICSSDLIQMIFGLFQYFIRRIIVNLFTRTMFNTSL